MQWRSGCSRASRSAGGDRRPHHLPPHDSTTLSDQGAAESARVIREMFGDEYYTGPRPVPDAREERPGGAPRRSADGLQAGAEDLERFSTPDELAHLRAGCGNARWPRRCRMPGCSRRRWRSPLARARRRAVRVRRVGQGDRVRRVSAAVRRGSDDPEAELAEQSRSCRPLKEGDRGGVARERRPRQHSPSRASTRRATRPQPPRATPKRRSSRSWRQAGIGGRPPTRRRLRPSSAAATCSGRGKAASCPASRPSRDAPAAHALRRLRRRRVHGRDGKRTRPDLERRARLGLVHPRVLPRR